MNRIGKIIFGLFVSMTFSCDDTDSTNSDEFTVVVESTADLACGLPLIRFTGNFIQVRSKTSRESLVYNAYHLDHSLNVLGTRLVVRFEDVAVEDLVVCNMLGMGYPAVAIVSARPDN